MRAALIAKGVIAGVQAVAHGFGFGFSISRLFIHERGDGRRPP